MTIDNAVGWQEPLRLSRRLESLHLALASSRRPVRILSPIDGGKACISRARRVPPVGFDVLEEGEDERRVELFNFEPIWLPHLGRLRGAPAWRQTNAFFRFLEYRLPSCLDQASRIHAIPMKKTDEALVGYLSRNELQALLDAPDRRTPSGIRDRAMLHLAFAAGLRVSELVELRLDQLDQPTLSSIHVLGKGRRERVLPLWKETTAALKAWLARRPPSGYPALFLNAVGHAMTRSGFQYILTKHVATAA